MHRQHSDPWVGVGWFISDKQNKVSVCRFMRTLAEEMTCSTGECPSSWIAQGGGKDCIWALGKGFPPADVPIWCPVCVSSSLSSVTDQHLNQGRSHSGFALSKDQQPMSGQSFNSIEDSELWGIPKWSPGLIGNRNEALRLLGGRAVTPDSRTAAGSSGQLSALMLCWGHHTLPFLHTFSVASYPQSWPKEILHTWWNVRLTLGKSGSDYWNVSISAVVVLVLWGVRGPKINFFLKKKFFSF